MDGWRAHLNDWGTIGGAHCGALGLGDHAHTAALERRWLELPAAAATMPMTGHIVFSRTARYLSHDFPWQDIIQWFGDRAVLLGTPQEYNNFVRLSPQAAKLSYKQTADLLEAAQIIQSADLFVVNQSSLFAIAEGLKKPRVLESFVPCANCEYGSRNCLPIRPGAKVSKERIIELLDAPFTI